MPIAPLSPSPLPVPYPIQQSAFCMAFPSLPAPPRENVHMIWRGAHRSGVLRARVRRVLALAATGWLHYSRFRSDASGRKPRCARQTTDLLPQIHAFPGNLVISPPDADRGCASCTPLRCFRNGPDQSLPENNGEAFSARLTSPHHPKQGRRTTRMAFYLRNLTTEKRDSHFSQAPSTKED